VRLAGHGQRFDPAPAAVDSRNPTETHRPVKIYGVFPKSPGSQMSITPMVVIAAAATCGR
jgi:hypothetical protein